MKIAPLFKAIQVDESQRTPNPSNGEYILSDIKPKNVLASEDGLAIFVIDADVVKIQP